jgi:predicted permease
MLQRLRLRLRALLRARAMENELDEELCYHLDNEIARNVARGMSAADAALAARRAFGNPTQLKEQVRDGWGRRWLERLGQDTRYALRSFRRAPTFSATVVLTIALALGLNTTAFTIFDAYVLRPVAVRDPGSLFQLSWVDRGGSWHVFSWNDYHANRANRDVLVESFAFRFIFTRIDSTPAFGQLVSGNYFSMLGVGAALGRTLVASDAADPGGAPVVVLSHDAWQGRFGADSTIVGKMIRIRGHALQVIGVAAPGFGGLGEVPMDFWAPLTMNDILFDGDTLFGARGAESLSLVGRLRPDITTEQGVAWLTSWMRARRADARPREIPAGAELLSRRTGLPLSPEFALFFAPIAAAFVLVLLIACADVANMFLARGLARRRELGIRLSLGAARGRLIAQLLTESVLLALPAALVGFVVSRVTIDGGVRLMFRTLPPELGPYMRVAPLQPDGRVFLFMLLAAVGSAILFGLAPALQATRPDIVQATRGDFDTDFRPSRLRNALVLGQVTVCVLLLVCAGILLRNVARLQSIDIGLRTHGIVRLDLTERTGTRERLLAALKARPDVRRLAAASDAPFGRRFPTIVAAGAEGRTRAVFYNFITGSYFNLLEIPIVHGRSFTTDEERAGAPVTIVSEATARAFWPDRDPIGQTLTLTLDTTGGAQRRFLSRRAARVVGIVPNVALGTLIDPLDAPVAYYPVADSTAGTALLAAVSGRPEVTMRRIDAALAQLAPDAVDDIHTLDAYMVAGVYPFRAAYWIAGALGAIALLLTLTGVYGVLSYVVVQRRKELGIRVALGASAAAIVSLVLGQSLRLCAMGLVLGCFLALGVSRIFAANIVRLETFEPVAFVGGALLVLASCLVAAYIPSRRAGRVDPLEALRTD